MNIPEGFLESEVREGFYIPAKLKRAWASILTVLNEVAVICSRHDIKWWADWGSMIAAVRHNGFIPWDDDIDISMMRPDFEKFLKVAPRELPKGYFFFNIYTDKTFRGYIARVSNGKTISIDNDYLEANHGCPYLAGVDVMCIDYVDPDEKEGREKRELIKNIIRLAAEIDLKSRLRNIGKYKKTIREIEGLCGIKFNEYDPIANQLYKAADSLMSNVPKEKAQMAACMDMYSLNDGFRAVFPKEYYEELIYLPYEFFEIPVPLHYDDMLKHIFGNYMQPIRGGGTHDYPFYCRQEDLILKEAGQILWKTCDFSGDLLGKTAISEQGETDEEKGNDEMKGSDAEKNVPSEKSKDVLFLIARAKNWIFFDKLYRESLAEKENNVYVIPIPYYKRTNTLGISEDVNYEASLFPEYVKVTGFDKYDFFGNNPDVVYFDTPYDLYDAYICVHPLFYTENIRKYAKKMVYVSCILADEFGEEDYKANEMMRFCINTPGVARADRVIVQSEAMKESYVRILTEWGGEDTREVWERKVVSGGLTAKEYTVYKQIPDDELSEEWKEVLYG